MAKIAPMVNSSRRRSRRNSSLLPSILSRPSSFLDSDKFDRLFESNLVLGFEENGPCFSELTSKLASILNSELCLIFLLDEEDHLLLTFLEDDEGNEIKVTKPLDRGITGSVLSDGIGIVLKDISSSMKWAADIDELRDLPTTSYLAWPLYDSDEGRCIGVVEFRNKLSNTTFDVADSQMTRIVAFQLSRAIIYSRQQRLLDGRNRAIKMAYEKTCDISDAIEIDDSENPVRRPLTPPRTSRLLFKTMSSRNAMSLAPGWNWKPSTSDQELMERGWGYDVFSCSDEQLISHAVDIFDQRGLFSRFSIPLTTFVNFLNEIKSGYNKEAPYHNHYHAFDVMHVCFLMITKCRADDFLDSFNVLSILVGALGHDLGHDGFNNAFHTASNSELAIMYNGMSVLENYSAAYLFRILRKERCNIFSRLTKDEMSKMRSRLIDLIIDTDASNHFMLMTRFKHGLEMKQLSRGLLSSMLLHVSDVSNPIRPGPIARKWAYAVQEEFFRQGDKEKELNLPISPFMDRDFENLPRMQCSFIDALVHPVFKLLAQFLPQVNEQCIKTLLSNRAFWSSMQHEGIVTIEQISFHVMNMVDECAQPRLRKVQDIFSRSTEDPIPGIPVDAPKQKDANIRKMSLISMSFHEKSHEKMIDPELGEITHNHHSANANELLMPRLSLSQKIRYYGLKVQLKKLLKSNICQMVLFFATIYSLFANDLNDAAGSKNADTWVDIFSLVVLVMFIIEIVISIICIPRYIRFFFWLDLIASISLFLEIDLLLHNEEISTSPGELSLARASRAAKAGARAGRLAKFFRLIRLMKVVKLLKWIMGSVEKTKRSTKDDTTSPDEEIDLKMSVVGKKMTESITKKVILAVMFMMILSSIMDTNYIPDARQFQLDAVALNPESQILYDSFVSAHDNLIGTVGFNPDSFDDKRYSDLRSIELLTLVSGTNSSKMAVFDISEEFSMNAWYSLGTTLVVTSLLALLSMLFSRDAYKIMIRPIEKMKKTVQKLSENPLLHLEKMKTLGAKSESNETDLLEQTINKMATLLQVGFGCAGAEIIAKSLSDMGEVDPMVPGVKVNAIFGFCDIREFTFATEHLQQDVMLFVNKIAQITHKHVVDSGGSPNKNIGDAFLLVWKLSSTKTGSRKGLQKELFDSSLSSFQSIIHDTKHIESLAEFMQDEQNTDSAWISSLKDFKVALGFGLHTGWAIEGSIGSKVKVDASYLSPHVNLASRLEAATKLYLVPLLMSDAFVSGLSGSIQSSCRRVDRVVFKGITEPITIYHQDITPFASMSDKPNNYAELLTSTAWKDKNEINKLGINLFEMIKALESEKNLLIRQVYDAAFNAYLDGEWDRCKVLFHLWLEKFPGDVVVQVLVEYLIKNNFKCPKSWKGYRIRQDK